MQGVSMHGQKEVSDNYRIAIVVIVVIIVMAIIVIVITMIIIFIVIIAVAALMTHYSNSNSNSNIINCSSRIKEWYTLTGIEIEVIEYNDSDW